MTLFVLFIICFRDPSKEEQSKYFKDFRELPWYGMGKNPTKLRQELHKSQDFTSIVYYTNLDYKIIQIIMYNGIAFTKQLYCKQQYKSFRYFNNRIFKGKTTKIQEFIRRKKVQTIIND